MAHDEVLLKLSCLLLRNGNVGELSETGCKSVNDCVLSYFLFNVSSCFVDSFLSVFSDLNFFIVSAHSDDLVDSEVTSINDYCHSITTFP